MKTECPNCGIPLVCNECAKVQEQSAEPVACLVPCGSVCATAKVDGEYYQIVWGNHHLATRWLYEHPPKPCTEVESVLPVAWDWVHPKHGMQISHSEPADYEEVFELRPLFAIAPKPGTDEIEYQRIAHEQFTEMQNLADQLTRYRAALDHQMVVTHLGVFNDGDDPVEAIKKLMDWSQGVGEYFARDKYRAVMEQAVKEMEAANNVALNNIGIGLIDLNCITALREALGDEK